MCSSYLFSGLQRGDYVGFLKFLKKPDAREKDFASGDNELEIPPPPEISTLSSDLPSFIGPRLEGSSVPPLKPLDKSSMAGYRQKPLEQPQLLDRLPELKPFEYGADEKKTSPQQAQALMEMPSPSPMPWDTFKQSTITPAITSAAPALELPKPAAHEALKALQFEPMFSQPEERETFERQAATSPAETIFDKPVFISASKYRQIIEDLDYALGRKSLSSETTALKDAEEREYGKLGSCLEDMQRKLMFVDKSLFEV
ncbi:hypothetical protein HYV82_05070 [Candidatus Woesearchaeota archaeon]|nr:hypothetical protein [Candidatus Woesearchaeota archaeon]